MTGSAYRETRAAGHNGMEYGTGDARGVEDTRISCQWKLYQ